MSPHLHRAVLLLQQSRPEMAERELRQALLDDPNDAVAHAFLAITLAEQDKLPPATEEAHAAIAAGPDLPLAHLALATVLRRRNRLTEAKTAIEEAIRLDPEEEDYWSELAQIELRRRDWKAALAAAEHGLAINAEDTACNNLRAVALVRLGRRDEAGATIDAALARDPHDPVTHANQGWTLLHAGEPRKAMEHFREALRLDPTSEWAKAGIVEAMKAKNPLYRWLLAYFLWTARLDRRVSFALIIGAWFGIRMLNNFGAKHPAAQPYILPVIIAYLVFCLSTWLGSPLMNLLLRLDRFGRHALSPDQIKSSNLVGLTVAGALGFLVAGLAVGGDPGTILLFDALWIGLLTIPVSMIYNCPAGWPRRWAFAIAGGLALWAGGFVVGSLVWMSGTMGWPEIAFRSVFRFYGWGILAASFAGNALMGATVRR